jgi:hypothetical protein
LGAAPGPLERQRVHAGRRAQSLPEYSGAIASPARSAIDAAAGALCCARAARARLARETRLHRGLRMPPRARSRPRSRGNTHRVTTGPPWRRSGWCGRRATAGPERAGQPNRGLRPARTPGCSPPFPASAGLPRR